MQTSSERNKVLVNLEPCSYNLNVTKFETLCYQARQDVWLTSEAGITNLVAQLPMSHGRQVPQMYTGLAIRARWTWNTCRTQLEATTIVTIYQSLVRYKFLTLYCCWLCLSEELTLQCHSDTVVFSLFILGEASILYLLEIQQVSPRRYREGQFGCQVHHHATSHLMLVTKWKYWWMLRLWSRCKKVMEGGTHVWLRYHCSEKF